MRFFLYSTYLLLLLSSSLAGLFRFTQLDKGGKILSIVVTLTFFSETISFYAAYRFHNNIPVYNVFNILEFVLICAYFNYSNAALGRHNTGVWVGIAGAAGGIADIMLQSLNHLNTYFIFFDGIFVISMTLYTFSTYIQNDDELSFSNNPHFWFGVCLAFFWSVTFLNWGLYDHFSNNPEYTHIINLLILLVNLLTYAGVGAVFIMYPKMKGIDGR